MEKNVSVEEAFENVPWLDLKKNLMRLGRSDIVDNIEKNTLITEGKNILHLRENI